MSDEGSKSAKESIKFKPYGAEYESEEDLMKKFNVSFPIDKRLWREDILVIHILV